MVHPKNVDRKNDIRANVGEPTPKASLGRLKLISWVQKSKNKPPKKLKILKKGWKQFLTPETRTRWDCLTPVEAKTPVSENLNEIFCFGNFLMRKIWNICFLKTDREPSVDVVDDDDDDDDEGDVETFQRRRSAGQCLILSQFSISASKFKST